MSSVCMPGSTLAILFPEQLLDNSIALQTVRGIALDSRKCGVGYVYFALAGASTHGIRYLDSVLEKGILALVIDSDDKELNDALRETLSLHKVTLIAVESLYKNVGNFAARYFGNSKETVNVIGVTGTDGKTSTSDFIVQALNACDRLAGVIGTIRWGIPGSYVESDMTTPDPIELHRQIFEIRQAGARYVCMEVSSHALDQGRVSGVEFKIAVLTNLARDHLDYHGSIERYSGAKQLLFKSRELTHAVINTDDAFGLRLLDVVDESVRVHTYAVEGEADLTAASVIESQDGLRIVGSDSDGQEWQTRLIGDFNTYNVLATVAVLRCLDVSESEIKLSVSALKPVEGRMEKFSTKKGPVVIVDYAHTPQALEFVLRSLLTYCSGALWCVFGCGGDRDKGKRAEMAAAAEKYAEHIVVTNDNPRFEEPESIVREIMTGFSEISPVVILDRGRAIEHAIGAANADDWVLIAGKGHEKYQVLGDQKLEFSDRQLVKQFLEACA